MRGSGVDVGGTGLVVVDADVMVGADGLKVVDVVGGRTACVGGWDVVEDGDGFFGCAGLCCAGSWFGFFPVIGVGDGDCMPGWVPRRAGSDGLRTACASIAGEGAGPGTGTAAGTGTAVVALAGLGRSEGGRPAVAAR